MTAIEIEDEAQDVPEAAGVLCDELKGMAEGGKHSLEVPDIASLETTHFAKFGIDDAFYAFETLMDPSATFDIEPPSSYFQVDRHGGNLLLVPGSPLITDFDSKLYNAASDNGQARVNAHVLFRAQLLAMAEVTQADIVIVDLGPSSSLLNQCILLGCDFILPPVFPDYFSLSSAHKLLTHLIPKMMNLG